MLNNSLYRLWLLCYAVNEMPPVGLTTVYNSINLCNYEKVRTQKVMQSNINNVIYRQARFNWLAQLLARMGGTVPNNDESEFRKRWKDEWIDYDRLKREGHTFELSQVAYWDECHIKQEAGTGVDETLIFSRNEDGLYDDEGEIDEEFN